MGGQIEVQSQPGIGAIFMFSIMLTRQAGKQERTFITARELKGLRVLLVEDHPVSREFLHNTLEAFSFSVTSEASAEAALARLEAQPLDAPYSLILMDLNLSGRMNGREAIQKIRQTPRLAELPIIALLSTAEILHQAESSHLDSYLVKPITRSHLFDAIMQILGGQRLASNSTSDETRVPGLPDQLRGQQLLLVEDNEINQIVAVAMLENLGLRVTVANNGEEALTLIEKETFQAVLMDIQMPGLDGYQVTAKIRSDPRFTAEKLPIIAMTAHALNGEREKPLRAGLNDYLSKPVDVNQLTSLLLHWLVPASALDPEKQTVKDAPENLLVDKLPSLDTQKALERIGNDLALYWRLLVAFQRDHAEDLQKIRQAVQWNDLALARLIAHSLKGLSGTIGASSLMEIATQLEIILAAGNQPAAGLLEQAESLLTTIVTDISQAKEFQVVAEAPLAIKNIDSLASQLRQLAVCLKENDGKATLLMPSILSLAKGSDLFDEIEELERFVCRYEYERALQSLQTLAQRWKIAIE